MFISFFFLIFFFSLLSFVGAYFGYLAIRSSSSLENTGIIFAWRVGLGGIVRSDRVVSVSFFRSDGSILPMKYNMS